MKKKLKHWEYSPDRAVSFGRFAGKLYRDLPKYYLEWLSRRRDHWANRVEWAKRELERREAIITHTEPNP